MKNTELVVSLCLISSLMLPISNAVSQADNSLISYRKTDRLAELSRAIENREKILRSPTLTEQQIHMLSGTSYQGIANDQAMIGDVFGAIESFGKYNRYLEEVELRKLKLNTTSNQLSHVAEFQSSEIEHAVIQDAIASITAEAAHRSIVILNEAHHVPMQRAFAMLLARELKKIGYQYLACEAFTNFGPSSPLSESYVSEKAGSLIREPTFGNFLRDAVKSKWKFVSYEPDQSPREYFMAKNLVDRIFKQHPDAKVFIYVGYSHARKSPKSVDRNDNSKMAAQLREMTGIDPLTIDQTTLFQQYNDKKQYAGYTTAINILPIDKPSVLMTPQGNYIKLGLSGIPDDAFDLQVIYPNYTINSETGRAGWLESLAGLVPHSIPLELIPRKGRRLIYVYNSGDPTDAVPVDVVLVDAGKTIPKLMLPEGKFRYAFED